MRIDHLVFLVRDLDIAARQWARRGYTVTPGGTPAGGWTHNKLVCLGETSYSELIAFRRAEAAPHRWNRFRPFPGLIDFAVRVDDIHAAVAKVRKLGLDYSAPADAGRTRPDGVELRWRGAMPQDTTLGLPFLIEDVTPRNLRVPAGAARKHRNGATGIASLDILTPDLGAALPHFGALFGRAIELARGAAVFQAGPGTRITLRTPARGRAAAVLALRGAGPFDWKPAK